MSGFVCIPSIASADMLHIAHEIDRVRPLDRLHLDIEDGNFVPNITFGIKMVRQIAEYCGETIALDAHLMMNNPELWIKPLADCGVAKLAVHMESVRYPLDTLSFIKRHGMMAGLALSFATPAEYLEPFIGSLDYILVMTAEPDGANQCFYQPILRKLKRIAAMVESHVPIWVDGSIGPDNIAVVARAGASSAIVGRTVFTAANPVSSVREMERIASDTS